MSKFPYWEKIKKIKPSAPPPLCGFGFYSTENNPHFGEEDSS